MKHKQSRRKGGDITVWVKRDGPFDPERSKVLLGAQSYGGLNQPRRGGKLQIDGLNRALSVVAHRSDGHNVTHATVVASEAEFDRLHGRGWPQVDPPAVPRKLRRRYGAFQQA